MENEKEKYETKKENIKSDSWAEQNELDEDDVAIDSENGVDEEVDNNQLTAYDIAVFYNTYNLSTLMKWWGKKLVVPEFQRAYVWKKKKASEFVDSVLRGLPVPSIFFYDDTDNNRLLVVDGQQRLKSLYAFQNGEFHGKKFTLTGNIHPRWNKRSYSELEQEDRDRFDDTLLNITVMRQLAPDDGQSSMYLAFQRINTGGETLNAQEIRMAVSYGPFAKLIFELANDKRFEKWDFLKTKEQQQNNNNAIIQELILKFFVYYLCYPDYEGNSTRTVLDNFFSEQKDFDGINPKKKKPDVHYYTKEELMKIFDGAFDELCHLDSKDFTPYTRPARILMEAIWVALTYRKLKLGKTIVVEKLKEYVGNWKNVIGEEKYRELFQTRRTTSMKETKERIIAAIDYFSGDF